MESEKVKEIKKALEDNKTDHLPYIDGWKCKFVEYADILTLINELESKNEKLKQHKRELEGGQRDLLKVIKEFNKEAQQLKDRIAELETKNEVLCVELSRYTEHCVEMKNGTLKQFAERLKEKIVNTPHILGGERTIIDETLKEFINE